MFTLETILVVNAMRTDEPKVPDFYMHMISFWMAEHDVKSIQFTLSEVIDEEE